MDDRLARNQAGRKRPQRELTGRTKKRPKTAKRKLTPQTNGPSEPTKAEKLPKKNPKRRILLWTLDYGARTARKKNTKRGPQNLQARQPPTQDNEPQKTKTTKKRQTMQKNREKKRHKAKQKKGERGHRRNDKKKHRYR